MLTKRHGLFKGLFAYEFANSSPDIACSCLTFANSLKRLILACIVCRASAVVSDRIGLTLWCYGGFKTFGKKLQTLLADFKLLRKFGAGLRELIKSFLDSFLTQLGISAYDICEI